MIARIALFGGFALFLLAAWLRIVSAATLQAGAVTCQVGALDGVNYGTQYAVAACGTVLLCGSHGGRYSGGVLELQGCSTDLVFRGGFEK